MSDVLEELADALARDVLAAQDELGDDRLWERVNKVLADSSPTLQDAYMLCIRTRLADRRARTFLEKTLASARAAGPKG
jgi:hypothetical protein